MGEGESIWRRRRVLTTVPVDFPALNGVDCSGLGLGTVDTAEISRLGRIPQFLQRAVAYDSILLNGSGRRNQLAAALLARGSSNRTIVISECTWGSGTWWLDRLTSRAAVKAIDAPQTTYCVLSRDELTLFPRTWSVDPSRVVFTPYCFTFTERELAAPTSTTGGVFAGGDSLRDYRPLLAAATRIRAQVTLAVKRDPANGSRLPTNVHATPVSHGVFVELMRHASVVVVPLAGGLERSAGQQTYLNAMALGKLVIATDSPGTRDYITHGSTGLIVAAGDVDGLTAALSWALDPAHANEVATMGSRARAVVRSRFRAIDYLRTLLAVVHKAAGAS